MAVDAAVMWRCDSCNVRITYTVSDGVREVCPNCQLPTAPHPLTAQQAQSPRPTRPVVGTAVVVMVDASYAEGLAGLAAVADGHDEIVRTVEGGVRNAAHAEQLAIGRSSGSGRSAGAGV